MKSRHPRTRARLDWLLIVSLWTGLLPGLLAGCQPSSRVPSRMDPDLIRAVLKTHGDTINGAVAETVTARRAYRNARKETTAAGEAVTLAVTELGVVKREIEARRETLAVKNATMESIQDDLERAEAQKLYDESLSIARIARRSLALARREHEHCALVERLALEESRLADARVELVRGNAALEIKLKRHPLVAIEDLREAVAFHDREIEIARRRLSEARARMTEAQAAYEWSIANESALKNP